jgi:hypothetical protein
MSPRLLHLLTLEHAPPGARDWIDSVAAADRMAGRRRPRWTRHPVVTA